MRQQNLNLGDLAVWSYIHKQSFIHKKKRKLLCAVWSTGHLRVEDISQVTRLTDTNKRFILKFCFSVMFVFLCV